MLYGNASSVKKEGTRMWGILKNDCYTSKKEMAATGIGLILASVLFMIKIPSSAMEDLVIALLLNFGYAFLSFTIFIGYGSLITSMILKNENPTWQSFLGTTKLGQKGYITQKYIFSIVVYMIASGHALLINSIANKINGVSVSRSFVLLFFLFFIVQAALELPCLLRFGAMYGSYIKIGLSMMVFFGVIIYGLYGNNPIFSEKNQDKMIDWALRIVSEGLNGPTAKKGFLIAGIVTVVLYGVSYEVSILTRKKS